MTIEERLESMERELGRMKRRNRWLLGAILIVVGGLSAPKVFETTASLARAQTGGTVKEIRARSIVIEDENGKTRATLAANKDGSNLALYDEKGKGRAGLTVIKDGPGLVLYDESGNARAALGALKDGPTLALYNENSANRVGLTVTKDGPTLALYDKNGTPRFVAGKMAIEMPDGKTIEYPESSLILYGPDGKVIWRAIK